MFILKIQKVEKSSNSCLRSPGMLFIFPSLINCSKQTYLTVLGNYYIYMSNNRINNNLYYTVIAVWNKLKQIEIPILNVPMCTHLATRLLKDCFYMFYEFLCLIWRRLVKLVTKTKDKVEIFSQILTIQLQKLSEHQMAMVQPRLLQSILCAQPHV